MLILVAVALALGPWAALARPSAAASTLVVINEVRLDRFPEVAVYFTAVDSAGLPLSDLSPDRLQLLHNAHSVVDFGLSQVDAAEEGLVAALAVDTSGSMHGRPIQDAREAVRELAGSLGPRDRLSLLAFADEVQVLQEFTGDSAALVQATDGLVARGDTRLYEGVFRAVDVAARQPLGRRAVVVITDGEDTKSSLTLDDAIAKARESNVPVYALGFGEVKADPLRRLTLITGGAYLESPGSDQLLAGLRRVADLLRKQYVLRYEAPDSRPTENEVQIVLSHAGQQARDARRFPAPPLPPLGLSVADLAPGARVRGVVELRPAISNASRATRVDYLLDGVPLHGTTEAPWSFAWDTAGVSPGEHELVVRAQVGDREAQQTLRLTVAPPIRLAVRSPTAGQEITGRVTLLADADSAAPLATVDWAVNGQTIGSASRPPFEVEWDATGAATGDHVITLEARDERGNSAQARQVVRIVAPPSIPPAAALPAPTTIPVALPAPTSIRTAIATPTSSSDTTSVLRSSIGPVPIVALLLLGIGLIAAVAFVLIQRSASTSTTEPAELPAAPVPLAAAVGATSHAYETAASGSPPARRWPEPETEAMLEPIGAGVRGQPGEGRLVVIPPKLGVETWPLAMDQIIGRASGDGVILIQDPMASRRHARISWEEGRFVYRDLSPTNPTLRDGRPIQSPHELTDGDRLLVGETEIVFRVTPDALREASA